VSGSKRDRLSRYSGLVGITRLLGLLPEQSGLVVLNYHRIGNPENSPYSAAVFSATAEEFEDHLRFLKKRLHLVPLDEALEIVESAQRPRGTAVLLTFDDGYIDNYETAFPILSAHNAQAVFFLPTAFIGATQIPWWDTVAYIINTSRVDAFHWNGQKFHLAAEGARPVIDRVMQLYKSHSTEDSGTLIARLEEACKAPRPGPSARCFMNWEEAAAMLRGGMAIGSHAKSHEILARLPAEEQARELVESKRELERRLEVPIHALSYPVGLPDSFSESTRQAARDAGYRAAFSFYGGRNRSGAIEKYDVRRYTPSAYGPRFRLQMTLAAMTGNYWL
jgi:peptidoglycan/xylan/chitin deacetylase (PgdA/CDA1 family)